MLYKFAPWARELCQNFKFVQNNSNPYRIKATNAKPEINKNITNQFILDCHTALNELGKTNKIETIWIPGHAGYQGNETADHPTKEGSKKQIEHFFIENFQLLSIIYRNISNVFYINCYTKD